MDASTSNDKQHTILIVDIVSSTALYEQLGNARAQETVAECLGRLSDTVESYGGKVVKSLGDGLLCVFEEGLDALQAALALWNETKNLTVDIRAGAHIGAILEQDADIFGDAVNTASRIADVAKPSEILISRALKDTLPRQLEDLLRAVPPIAVKGKRDPLELYAILRRDVLTESSMGQTLYIQPQKGSTTSIGETLTLELRYRQEQLLLGPGEALTLGRGRGQDIDLKVEGPKVSRYHARIFHRQGKYVIQDQSANGTYLVPAGQTMLHLVREEAILHGSGLVYLGDDPEDHKSEPILYAARQLEQEEG